MGKIDEKSISVFSLRHQCERELYKLTKEILIDGVISSTPGLNHDGIADNLIKKYNGTAIADKLEQLVKTIEKI